MYFPLSLAVDHVVAAFWFVRGFEFDSAVFKSTEAFSMERLSKLRYIRAAGNAGTNHACQVLPIPVEFQCDRVPVIEGRTRSHQSRFQ